MSPTAARATSVATSLAGVALVAVTLTSLVPRLGDERAAAAQAEARRAQGAATEVPAKVQVEASPVCPPCAACPPPAACPEAAACPVCPSAGPASGVSEEVFFANASARLTARALARLDDLVAGPLRAKGKIVIQGHTDPRGSTEENERLAELRARSVASYLMRKGVDPARFEFAPGVVESPGDANTEASWAMHRRVQLTLKP